jgi:hypothetical protein
MQVVGLNHRPQMSIIKIEDTAMKKMEALRKVHMEIGGEDVVGWQAKDPALRALGRWTDPEALLRRIDEIQHPEKVPVIGGPGRQWQATWRGRFSAARRPKSRKAA